MPVLPEAVVLQGRDPLEHFIGSEPDGTGNGPVQHLRAPVDGHLEPAATPSEFLPFGQRTSPLEMRPAFVRFTRSDSVIVPRAVTGSQPSPRLDAGTAADQRVGQPSAGDVSSAQPWPGEKRDGKS